MVNQRMRPILISAAALLAVWVVAVIGFNIAKNAKVTADKIRSYVESIDLSKLSAADRAKAIAKLADMLNRMSPEERQKARIERAGRRWFDQMTEDEKGTFIEATMPSGFKQMLAAFEELPEDKRRRAVDDAVKRLKQTQAKIASGELDPSQAMQGTNDVQLSEELQAKVRTIGLKAFYSQSTAQTKAELAPVMEELQKVMESGRMLRNR
jgi:hypothetical protein